MGTQSQKQGIATIKEDQNDQDTFNAPESTQSQSLRGPGDRDPPIEISEKISETHQVPKDEPASPAGDAAQADVEEKGVVLECDAHELDDHADQFDYADLEEDSDITQSN